MAPGAPVPAPGGRRSPGEIRQRPSPDRSCRTRAAPRCVPFPQAAAPGRECRRGYRCRSAGARAAATRRATRSPAAAEDRRPAGFGARPHLVAHVDLGRRILADQHDAQLRRAPVREVKAATPGATDARISAAMRFPSSSRADDTFTVSETFLSARLTSSMYNKGPADCAAKRPRTGRRPTRRATPMEPTRRTSAKRGSSRSVAEIPSSAPYTTPSRHRET